MTAPLLESPSRQAGQRGSRGRGRWALIGLGGIVALFALRIATAGWAPGLPDRLQDLLTLSISVIIESLPFVVLGIVLSIAVQVWIPDTLFLRLLPKNRVARRIAISLLGVASPGLRVRQRSSGAGADGQGPHGVGVDDVPARSADRQPDHDHHDRAGLRLDQRHPDLPHHRRIPDREPDRMAVLPPEGPARDAHRPVRRGVRRSAVPGGGARGAASGRRFRESVDLFVHESGAILPALFLGAIAAGVVQVLVPREVLVTLGTNPLWSIVAMMALAFIISVCSNVDAFFILPFASTFLPGSIVSFLVFGPLIDIKMLALMRTTFRTRVLVQLTVVIALASALVGLVVNLVS